MHACVCVHACVFTQAHGYVCVCVHACVFIQAHVCVCVCVCGLNTMVLDCHIFLVFVTPYWDWCPKIMVFSKEAF